MCRHFAYLGPPVRLSDLILAPPYGLIRQSWAPRRQVKGRLNADGFGVGWYPGNDAPPVRYRRSVPIWTDSNLESLTRGAISGAVLGAVRSASPPNPIVESATAPFTSGRYLFSHNGLLAGWPASGAELAAEVPWPILAGQATLIDSTLLWAVLLAAFERGVDPVDAIATLTRRARSIPGSRVNLLLHDGARIIATAAGDTLCYRHGEHRDAAGRTHSGVIVASEPFDDADGWVEVPDDHLLIGTTSGVTVHQLSDVATRSARPASPSLESR